jgi:hypothetical protein
VDSLVKDQPTKIGTDLDVIKYVGLDFWKALFDKQASNVKTNNQGDFMIIDSDFKFVRSLSCAEGETKELKERMKCFEHLTQGLVKGAITNLGFDQSCKVSVGLHKQECKI